MKLNPQQIKRQMMEPEKKLITQKNSKQKKNIIKRMRVKIKIKNKLEGLLKVSIERLN
jgi:hypothetical protein